MKLDWETVQRARPDIYAKYVKYRGKQNVTISAQQLYRLIADVLPEKCSTEEIEHKILRYLTGENA